MKNRREAGANGSCWRWRCYWPWDSAICGGSRAASPGSTEARKNRRRTSRRMRVPAASIRQRGIRQRRRHRLHKLRPRAALLLLRIHLLRTLLRRTLLRQIFLRRILPNKMFPNRALRLSPRLRRMFLPLFHPAITAHRRSPSHQRPRRMRGNENRASTWRRLQNQSPAGKKWRVNPHQQSHSIQ